MTDVYVFRLIEDGGVAVTAVVHVDDIFAVGQKERCDRLCMVITYSKSMHQSGKVANPARG